VGCRRLASLVICSSFHLFQTPTVILHRRAFVAGATAAIAAQAGAPRRSLHPEQFGAKGDGETDDTAALQRCIDVAAADRTVELRRGAVYRIDTNFRPTHGQFGGLKLKTGTIFQLNGSALIALGSRSNQGCLVNAYRVNGWRVEGPGRIVGERHIHMARGGEWGMGIACWGAGNWQICSGIEISDCWGDGIYLGYSRDRDDFCENYRIEGVHIHGCRRCGIGHIAGRNGRISGVHIHDISGTGPSAGIDFEADFLEQWSRNVIVTGARIYDCEIGVDVSTSNDSITITGCHIVGRNSGIIIGKPVSRIRIVDNPGIGSEVGGSSGGAVRTAVGAASGEVSDVLLSGNHFFGGGQFVLDIVGQNYRDVVIENNEIRASNRGVQGVARLGNLRFVGNKCIIEQLAGKADDYFLYIAGGSYGRNEYLNRSGLAMHSIAVRSRDLGGDRYDAANLTQIITR